MRALLCASVCVVALAAATRPAAADVRDLRLGIVKHNILDGHHREQSENIEGEIVWDSPWILKIFGAPRPYAEISVNDQGYTSFISAGFYWRLHLSKKWVFEPGIGYALHNGKLDVPAGAPEPRVLLGSRQLFRETVALEREMGPHLATQVYYEHLSNGEVLGARRNQGLDEAGMRFIYRFKQD